MCMFGYGDLGLVDWLKEQNTFRIEAGKDWLKAMFVDRWLMGDFKLLYISILPFFF